MEVAGFIIAIFATIGSIILGTLAALGLSSRHMPYKGIIMATLISLKGGANKEEGGRRKKREVEGRGSRREEGSGRRARPWQGGARAARAARALKAYSC